ncbi:MAG: hypothetical protein FWF90_15705 [Promicromonosporaceae bacterium]|nr:hypothetical protein [Promicromonosporaceae bacterium]
MSTARVRQSDVVQPGLVEAHCDLCGWTGPTHDLAVGQSEDVLVRLEALEHTCGDAQVEG